MISQQCNHTLLWKTYRSGQLGAPQPPTGFSQSLDSTRSRYQTNHKRFHRLSHLRTTALHKVRKENKRGKIAQQWRPRGFQAKSRTLRQPTQGEATRAPRTSSEAGGGPAAPALTLPCRPFRQVTDSFKNQRQYFKEF